ncbi:MAG TPA: glutamate-cysteine ligase family protein, partial [Rubrobacter sp.]|nr:glutamate-cysteine ligase family protein [Rubrobacter sp.]
SLALGVASGLGLGLYPLGTYPLPTRSAIREVPRYRLEARTIGHDRFLHAGRCAGVHVHIEAPPGTIWPDVKAARAAPAAREEMLDLYNLATALDPALVAISRACPFYEGRMSVLATRTVHCRGGFGPDGVYAKLQEVGALRPYAATVEDLKVGEREHYRTWYAAMDLAGVERALFSLTVADLHRASWNPVRLNRHGTIEIRSMDSNYPDVTLAVYAVVCGAFDRVRYERLRVRPIPGVRALKSDGDALLVPDFAYLSETLVRAAVKGGVKDQPVADYLGSLLRFAAPYVEEPEHVGPLLDTDGGYRTTEAEIRRLPGMMPSIPRAEGLRLVRESCRHLEEQVRALRRGRRGALRDAAPRHPAPRHPAPGYVGGAGRGRQGACRSSANGVVSAALARRHGSGPSSELEAHWSDVLGQLVVLPARVVKAQRLEKGES